ncbi:small integral membrane protein 29-like isoform X1 [Pristis pectinata]|uniref:small integral membrane protein 29-like isoform X1 n=1 Tax=Pristis pectinata TaxID=685728 RepID=UPI00223E2925|nr:small integral membrane protein 29-like isoform X1 [Pristis pectinata]XP_051886508.1 small integral membrane protein 29-like isoform X1 [Pristis pectinata]
MPNQTATTTPDSNHSVSVLGFMLIPVTLLAAIGIAIVVVRYVRKRRRLENLRNKLVPIYSYDPSEDHNDVEEEIDTNGEIKDNYELSAEKETRQNVNCASSSDTGIGNQETGALDEKQVLKTESGQ